MFTAAQPQHVSGAPGACRQRAPFRRYAMPRRHAVPRAMPPAASDKEEAPTPLLQTPYGTEEEATATTGRANGNTPPPLFSVYFCRRREYFNGIYHISIRQ